MSIEQTSNNARRLGATRWAGTAFLVEAMLLLAFIVISIAITTQMFAASLDQSKQSLYISEGVSLSSSLAERFAASPGDVQSTLEGDHVYAVCEVTSESRASGTVHHALITAYDRESGAVVYTIETERYESGGSV